MKKHKKFLLIIMAALSLSGCRMVLPTAPSVSSTSSRILLASSTEVIKYMKESQEIDVDQISLIMIEERMYRIFWKARQIDAPNYYIISLDKKTELFNPAHTTFKLGKYFIENSYKYEVQKNDTCIQIIKLNKIH